MAEAKKKKAAKLVVLVTQGCSSSFTVEVLATASELGVQTSGRSGFRFSSRHNQIHLGQSLETVPVWFRFDLAVTKTTGAGS